MKLYSENEHYKLYQGNMLDMLEVIKHNSIDSIITDPPYELNFMNKGWDNSGIAFQSDTWKQCYEVLKPGGYLLAFGGSRTFHRIACAIEDAGFEIRDTIMWLYGSGFPKSLNIGLALDKKNGIDNRTGNIKTDGKATNSGSNCYNCNNGKDNSMKQEYEERIAQNEWNGWGTSLKPSYEPIIVARKPFKSSLVDNVIEYGVGGINIEECRVGTEERTYKGCSGTSTTMIGGAFENGTNKDIEYTATGRFPANTILTYDDTDFEEVCGGFPDTKGDKRETKYIDNPGTSWKNSSSKIRRSFYNDNGGSASRYFYCAKASKKDRDEGLEEFEDKLWGQSGGSQSAISKGEEYHKDGIGLNQTKLRKNTHPTVKPTELMQYLIRLVSPKGSTILDCFNGSGSTGKAVMYENKERDSNYKYIGIELTEEYLPIAKARIEYSINSRIELEEKSEDIAEGQTSIFDFIVGGKDGYN